MDLQVERPSRRGGASGGASRADSRLATHDAIRKIKDLFMNWDRGIWRSPCGSSPTACTAKSTQDPYKTTQVAGTTPTLTSYCKDPGTNAVRQVYRAGRCHSSAREERPLIHPSRAALGLHSNIHAAVAKCRARGRAGGTAGGTAWEAWALAKCGPSRAAAAVRWPARCSSQCVALSAAGVVGGGRRLQFCRRSPGGAGRGAVIRHTIVPRGPR